MRFAFKELSASLLNLVKVDERMNHTEIANHNPLWKSTFLDVISAVSMAGGSII